MFTGLRCYAHTCQRSMEKPFGASDRARAVGAQLRKSRHLQRRMICWAWELHLRNGNLTRSGLWPLGLMLLRIVSRVPKEEYPCNKPMSTTNRGERLRWRCGVTETIT